MNSPFSQIQGHEQQRRYLKTLVDAQRMPQSIILYGKSGIGKSLVVRELISYMFCEADSSRRPCGLCKHCKTVAAGTHPDLIEILPDAKGSIKVGEADERGTVRWMVGRLGQKAVFGKYAVIVNGCDMIQDTGQNALLKTLEDAPQGSVIFLITDSLSAVLPTIRSRSMLLQFAALTVKQLEKLRSPLLPLPAIFSGGSVPLYDHFAESKTAQPFIDALLGVKAFFENSRKIDIDFKSLSATFADGATMAIEALLGFYDYNLSCLYSKAGGYELETENYFLKDPDAVRIVIRSLLKLRADTVFHVNGTLAFSTHISDETDRMKKWNILA